MLTCAHVCVCVCVCVRFHVAFSRDVHVCVCVCQCVCVVCWHTHTYPHTHMCTRVCVCVSVCVWYADTHTHTHTQECYSITVEDTPHTPSTLLTHSSHTLLAPPATYHPRTQTDRRHIFRLCLLYFIPTILPLLPSFLLIIQWWCDMLIDDVTCDMLQS